jgi:hypothetical protein
VDGRASVSEWERIGVSAWTGGEEFRVGGRFKEEPTSSYWLGKPILG